MRLLLDECLGDKKLVRAVGAAGHDVVRSVDALGAGADDTTVFAFACTDARAVVTSNSADFVALGGQQPKHSGLLLVYQDNRPSDMTTADIVKALANVESAHPSGIAGQIVVLNMYKW